MRRAVCSPAPLNFSAMRFDLITIFPEFFAGPLNHGIVRRAAEAGIVQIQVQDLREFTKDRHRTVDDRPFGGGGTPPAPLWVAPAPPLPPGPLESNASTKTGFSPPPPEQPHNFPFSTGPGPRPTATSFPFSPPPPPPADFRGWIVPEVLIG